MVDAVEGEIDRLARAAEAMLPDPVAKAELAAALKAAREKIATRHTQPIGAGTARAPA